MYYIIPARATGKTNEIFQKIFKTKFFYWNRIDFINHNHRRSLDFLKGRRRLLALNLAESTVI